MNKKLFLVSLISIFSLCVNGQLNVRAIDSATGHQSNNVPGNVINQLAGAIKPTSYNNTYSKEKKAFLKNTEKISDPQAMAKNISLLAKFIKPNKFKTGVSPVSILKDAGNISSMSQVAALLKNLEAGLKPEAFSGLWAMQRNSWLNEVKELK